MKIIIPALLALLTGLAPAQTNITVGSNVHSLLQAPSYAAIRGLLDLEPGTDFLSISAIAAAYQPLDADLTAIAALTTTAGARTALTLADPNADRIMFWDDSANTYAHLTVGSGLLLSGTTLTAPGSGFDEAGSYALTGTWDFDSATVTFGTFTATTLNATNLQIASTAVTSSAAELNALDGVPAGLTAAELGVLDGIPGGLTATEIGYADGVTSAIQTQLDTKITASSTSTLTNKRITQRIATLTDAATVTPATDSYDGGILATVSQTTAFANPTGTPTDFQSYAVRLKSTSVQTLSWGTQYRGNAAQPLPTATTGSSLTEYFLFRWNAADSKWDMLSKTEGF